MSVRLVGYTDRLSVAPGESIACMISSAHPTYRADLVRLVHGDPNPLGPGFIEEVVASPVSGAYSGRTQSIVTGSYVRVENHPALALKGSFTVQAWILPTTPDKGRQGLISRWSPVEPAGFSLLIDDGKLTLWLAGSSGQTHAISAEAPLRAGTWYFVAATFDAATGDVHLRQEPLPAWPLDTSRSAVSQQTGNTALRATEAPLFVAALASGQPGQVANHFNGKVDRPGLFSRALSPDELESLRDGKSPLDLDGVVAAWDFAQEIASSRVIDSSPNGLHGTAVNLPTRAVTGANWTGDESNVNHAPQQYGAIHFHDDDLDDAGWEVDFTLTVPEELPSGVYAVRLRAGEDEDHLPFIVRPPRGASTSPIAVLFPTFTYLAYANEHMPVEPLSLFPFADMNAHAGRVPATSPTTTCTVSTTPTTTAPVSATPPGSDRSSTYDRRATLPLSTGARSS